MNAIVNSGCRAGELSPASVYVSLLPVVEACVVVAVPGRVGEVRVAADEPEAVDLDPGVLARRLDAPATVKAVLEQGGRVLLRSRAVRDPGPSGGRVRGVAKQRPSFLRNFAEGTEDDLKMLILIITKRVFFGTDSGEPFVTLSLRRHKTPSMGHRHGPEGCPEAVGAAEESGFLLPARHRALRRFKCKNTLFYYHGA